MSGRPHAPRAHSVTSVIFPEVKVKMSSPLPSVGTRLCLHKHLATIRYVGEVDGTKGTWLGVEWDDPSRGKHDGIKDGKQYFSCLVPNAGSFIRPVPAIDYGRSFLQALTEKYIEAFHGAEKPEVVVLGSSNGAIQVEAVDLDKIRQKFAKVERLREISLDKENVSSADPEGLIRTKCPSNHPSTPSRCGAREADKHATDAKGVDLSYSLIPSWDVIALIARELPLLERLALNNDRLQAFSSAFLATNAFQGLTELELNATLMTWQEMLDVVTLMPILKQVEMGYNRLTKLLPARYPDPFDSGIEVVNLDGNQLSDWTDVCRALAPFTRLNRLILSTNPLSTIPTRDGSSNTDVQPLPQVKHLALLSAGISTWESVDALNSWLPGLESLSLSGTPLVEGKSLNFRNGTHPRCPNWTYMATICHRTGPVSPCSRQYTHQSSSTYRRRAVLPLFRRPRALQD
ncbi:hypothetical protein EVG20_g1128 [Dentipellis fragilis]|uniref:CAP-Gly domain-containing protein n=1 Tax=Dentipellis fragilis TaxID=205917 RepID=A0A4Y9ZAJ4_9AGAM|nr:hypothetical protein EVG20_g1128 [Dentipellis fragilis]